MRSGFTAGSRGGAPQTASRRLRSAHGGGCLCAADGLPLASSGVSGRCWWGCDSLRPARSGAGLRLTTGSMPPPRPRLLRSLVRSGGVRHNNWGRLPSSAQSARLETPLPSTSSILLSYVNCPGAANEGDCSGSVHTSPTHQATTYITNNMRSYRRASFAGTGRQAPGPPAPLTTHQPSVSLRTPGQAELLGPPPW